MKTLSIVYGLCQGQITHIDNVEKGLECDCTCAECGSRLVAHKGGKIIHHFKHFDREEGTSCFETAIHLASKRLFSIQKKVVLPKLRVFVKQVNDERTVLKKKEYKIKAIQTEQTINNFRPDIFVKIAVKGTEIPLIIEIAVTHFVDNEKLEKIKKSNISAIEISLKNFVH